MRRGRKLSDSGAKARFFHEVCDASLARIIKVDLKSDLFSYAIDEAAQQRAELMDGKLLLVANVTDLSIQEIVKRSASRWPTSNATSGCSSPRSRSRSRSRRYSTGCPNGSRRTQVCAL